MRRAHRLLVEKNQAVFGEYTPKPATAEDLAGVERRLGRPIPPSYKSFLEELGSVAWPLEIYAATGEPDHLPAYLVAFAHDGGGNYHCFDLRAKAAPSGRAAELPITFWDHEEPEAAEQDAPADDQSEAFADWLEEQIDEALWVEVEERRERLSRALAPHAAGAFTPSLDEAQQAGEKLGVELPADYLWFTTTLGSIAAPVRVVDATQLAALTEAMRRDVPRAPEGLVAFAEEAPARYVGFDRKGKLVRVEGGKKKKTAQEPGDPTFTEYLERRVAEAPAAPPVQDRLGAAKQLLSRLIEREAIEVEPSFELEAAATALADAQISPRRLSRWLMERADIAEVFASDAELEAILKS